MPKLTRMSEDEVNRLRKQSRRGGVSSREQTRRQYVDYLSQFKPGDWVSVEFEDGDNKQTVRNRLMRAAKDLGWKLNFVRTRGTIRFEIQSAE